MKGEKSGTWCASCLSLFIMLGCCNTAYWNTPPYTVPVTRRSFSPSAVTKEGASAETSHLGDMAENINTRTIIFFSCYWFAFLSDKHKFIVVWVAGAVNVPIYASCLNVNVLEEHRVGARFGKLNKRMRQGRLIKVLTMASLRLTSTLIPLIGKNWPGGQSWVGLY